MTTIRKIITGSLGRLNAASANSVPTDEDIQVGLSALNALIDSLSNNIQNVYTTTPYRFPLTNGKQTYKLGPEFDVEGNPTNADWIVDRPMRIENAVLMAYANISYPPPQLSCNLKQCQLDDNALALWHFDEADFPTVNSVNESHIDLNETEYNLTPDMGACDGSLWLSADNGQVHFNLAYEAPDLDPTIQTSPIDVSGQTFEFSITRNGSPASPVLLDWFEIDVCYFYLFNYGEGNEAYVTLKLIDHGYGPYWTFYNYDYSFICDIYAPDVIDWHTLTLEYDIDLDRFKIFDNGTIIYENLLSYMWDTSLAAYSVSGWWFYPGSSCSIDEARQSDFYRYPADYDIRINGFVSLQAVATTPQAVIEADSGTLFLPLQLANYAQFSSITVRKLTTTWPTTVYDNGAYPVRELSFWPVPVDVSLAAELWLWEPLATYETIDDELNLPPGYERYFILKLAMELAPEFGKVVTDVMRANLEEAEKLVKTLNQMTTISEPSSAGRGLWPSGNPYARSSKVSNRIPRTW